MLSFRTCEGGRCVNPEDQKEFADDMAVTPPSPEPAERHLPLATLAMAAGLVLLILLLAFSY